MTSSNCSCSLSLVLQRKVLIGLVRPRCARDVVLRAFICSVSPILSAGNSEPEWVGKVRKGFRWREHLRSFLHSD
jgi:hypothetical protein